MATLNARFATVRTIEQLQRELQRALPVKLYNQVHWVIERKHWQDIEVAFFQLDAPPKIVHIDKEDWLNDVAIARICLEAM